MSETVTTPAGALPDGTPSADETVPDGAPATLDRVPSGFPPDGARLTLNRHTRTADAGTVLIGGTPARVARLKPGAAGALRDGPLTVSDAGSRRLASYLLDAGLADPDPRSLPPRELADVTVVIPTYRRARQLDRLLRSVRAGLGRVRIVVVDDGSGAGTEHASGDKTRDGSGDATEAIVAAARQHGADVVRLPENQGPADARNAGLALVDTPFVLFVDIDVVLHPHGVALLLRHFADPRLAAVAPRVLGMPRPDDGWILRYENTRSSLDHGESGSLVRPHSPMSWVSTTCLLARVSALGDGFGHGMRVAEDVDLVWRLTGQGWRVRYEPSAVVQHEHRDSVRAWLGRKFTYGTGAASLARRHDGLVAPAVLAPWTAAALAALAAQRAWSLPVAGAIAVVATMRNARRLGSVDKPTVLAARLTAYGLTSAVAQACALAVRHWWPGVAVVAVFSPRARRIVVVAALADATWEYVRLRPGLDPVRFALARRLDDLAYGAGVWWGAWRARSGAALQPALTGQRPRSRRSWRRPGNVHGAAPDRW
ncbi:mycofactocin biosynthesis glycosyltransferase MftF [Georgenia halophila]|uniref:Mycofactocin biosynthesis glycosyltransferase MftF n=1 Tax=Georgenia halophila TaxID=620889 RepID=A0ABP8KV48_9MICO